jgi:hypothetical protein
MAELDLDAILAQQDEAKGEPHKVVWGGQTFLVPRMSDWPLEWSDLLMRGNITAALSVVLGDQWDAFWTAKHPTTGAAEALLNGIAEREGLSGLGESLPSQYSPNRTARRSRPTSSGTTK